MDFFGDLILSFFFFFQIRVNLLESKMQFSIYSVQKVIVSSLLEEFGVYFSKCPVSH